MTAQVRATHPDGVDAVLHFAGDPSALLSVVRPGGRFASTQIMKPEQVPSDTVLVKPVYALPTAEVLSDLAYAVASGRLTVPIQRTYPLDAVPAALRDFAQEGTRGKLAIRTR